jgi:hypothetical protein
MKYKYFLYILPLITLLFSCEKVIEFNGDEVKTKLVLNSILTPDSIVKIQLTESRFFLDSNPTFNPIDDADVKLWKDGSLIEPLQNTGEGYYTGTYIPCEGDNLRITASCSGFDPVECEMQIVSPTPIISVDTTNTSLRKDIYYKSDYGEGGFWTTGEDGSWITADSVEFLIFEGNITIKFKDHATIAGYYAIMLEMHIHYENGNVYVWPVNYTSDDMVFKTNNEITFDDDDYQFLYIFSDELFDGKEYALKIKARGVNMYFPADDSKITGQEMQVTLQSLSPSYYMYLKTRDANSESNFFTEPVQIYTNIKGGIGIFGNYSNSIYRIPLS